MTESAETKINVTQQALNSAAQLGLIGKFSRGIVACRTFTDIMDQSGDLLNSLNISGLLLVYKEHHVAKTIFGNGLWKIHVDEINTEVLAGDKVILLKHILVFNRPHMNLVVSLDDIPKNDVGLYQDNLSIWFDTFDSVINAFCDREALLVEKESMRSGLAGNVRQIVDAMEKHDKDVYHKSNALFEDYICKISTILPSLALEEDQEDKMTDLMHNFVNDFKYYLDKQISYNMEL